MNIETIKEKLAVIFKEVFKSDDIVITDALTAADVAGWDSLSNLSMVDRVEKEFGIKLKLREIISMQNVGDLIRTIHGKLNP